jgi:hypothetical protein
MICLALPWLFFIFKYRCSVVAFIFGHENGDADTPSTIDDVSLNREWFFYFLPDLFCSVSALQFGRLSLHFTRISHKYFRDSITSQLVICLPP